MFTDLIDPTSEFQAKNKPIKPEGNEEEENPDEVDLEIYKEEVKQFVQRKMNVGTCGYDCTYIFLLSVVKINIVRRLQYIIL